MRLRPLLLLLLGVISVSFAAIFIRLAEAPALVIAMYRLVIASLLILPFTWKSAATALKSIDGRTVIQVIMAGVFLAAHFMLWITSLEYTSIASSVILVTAHPVFVAAVSYVLWKEKLNRLSILGIIIAMAGIVTISGGGLALGSGVFIGNTMALTAGLFAASYLMIGRVVREKINAAAYLLSVYGTAAAVLLALTLLTGAELTGYSQTTYVMFFLLAIIPQLLGHSSFNLAARIMPVTIVSVAILGEPVGATLLGIFILGERPGAAEIIGGGVILLGIYLVLKGGRVWFQRP